MGPRERSYRGVDPGRVGGLGPTAAEGSGARGARKKGSHGEGKSSLGPAEHRRGRYRTVRRGEAQGCIL